MNEFKTHRNKSLLFGLFTFILPLSIGYPACYYFLGYNFNASFLTASMFATHTLLAYPIVSRFGISKNQAVAITVGGTILTDTAVLLILAVIMENNQGNLNQYFWIRLGISLAIFSAIMFLLIPRIAKWFFRKLESEKHSHYIFVLSVVFFSAFLAQVAGVEPIIGAFVAGLALNKLIPSSSALMNRIEFIGNSLFIPFFLISVGMLVDVKIILSGPGALIVAATLTVVALTGKWFASLFTQLVFRYSNAQRQLIFGLSSAHAAATLAVILVGYKAGILDENILNGTIILILITCIVASFVTDKAAKKIVLERDEDSTDLKKTSGLNNEHILLPMAKMELMEKLLQFSILIKDTNSANPVSMLAVESDNDEAEKNIVKTKNKLLEFVHEALASETKVNVITTIDHNPGSGISRIAREIMASIIILDWPQRSGILDKLLGEKLDAILSNTDKTMFVCHLETPLVLHKRILVAVRPQAEHDYGFTEWVSKIAKLAQELSIPIILYSNTETSKSVEAFFKKARLSAGFVNIHFDAWEDFLVLSRDVHLNDLFVLVSARKGSSSFMSLLENLPAKMEKHFASNSRIVIYPKQYGVLFNSESFDDIPMEPLNKGIETIQRLGKGIAKIFKNE